MTRTVITPIQCQSFHSRSILSIKLIERTQALHHILSFHKHNTSLKKIFIGSLKFFLQGISEELQYLYLHTHNFLIRMPDNSIKHVTREIFEKKVYNLTYPKDDPIIVDIGSHVGVSILFFAHKFPDAKIFGFEANPYLFNILKENIAHNLPTKNMSVINKAVVQKKKNNSRSFFYSPLYSGTGSLESYVNIYSKYFKTNRKVNVRTIEFSAIIKNLKEIDILKLDVEGAEYELLPTIIKFSDKIHSILIEVHKSPNNNNFDFLAKLSKKYLLSLANTNYSNYLFDLDHLISIPMSSANYIVYGKNRESFKKYIF